MEVYINLFILNIIFLNIKIKKYEKIADIIATQIIYFKINLIGRIYMKKTLRTWYVKEDLKKWKQCVLFFKSKDLIVGRCKI